MKTDLKTFFKRLYQKALFEEDILSTAAQVAFYFSFALFPAAAFFGQSFRDYFRIGGRIQKRIVFLSPSDNAVFSL